MILIFSYPGEEHTDAVQELLAASGCEVVRLDLADFPAHAEMELCWETSDEPAFHVSTPAGIIDLSAADVCWWRRVRPHTLDSALTDAAWRAFALSETNQALGGVLDSLPCAWVNPRRADEAAHHKTLQWTVARQVGLSMPRTLVTTRPEAARAFIQEIGVGKVVYKAFLAMMEAWRETRLVSAADLARLDSVRLAPVIFQEYVEGVDLRITVVGNQIFAAEIDARDTSYPQDMRMVIGEARIRPVQLPPPVEAALLRLQKQLGLVYGAIDMRRTVDDKYVFLEVNPAGQWLFAERYAGLKISQAMADLLIRFDRSPRPVSEEPRRHAHDSRLDCLTS